MIIRKLLMTAPLMLLMWAEVGCGSSREVAIKGQLASSATVEGPVTVQFFEIAEAEKPALVHSIKLDSLVAFDAKAAVAGDQVLVRAINDRDGNALCSAGEPWAEVRASIKDDDTVDAVALDLTTAACPAE